MLGTPVGLGFAVETMSSDTPPGRCSGRSHEARGGTFTHAASQLSLFVAGEVGGHALLCQCLHDQVRGSDCGGVGGVGQSLNFLAQKQGGLLLSRLGSGPISLPPPQKLKRDPGYWRHQACSGGSAALVWSHSPALQL